MDQASMRFLEAAKRVTPSIGGPWQIVRLDSTGTHLVSLPEWSSLASDAYGEKSERLRILHGANSVEVAAGGVTIVGGVLTSPTITIVNGTVTINLDAVNYFKLVDTGANRIVQADNTGVKAGSTSVPAQYAKLDANGALVVSNSAKLLSIGAGYSATASPGSGTLPAAPVGFMEWIFGGATVHIPYYN
jgi:hypothetical protein